MEPFELPHRHEDASHLHELEEYLRRTEYFQTVALVFRQLSDANRVRLFWLLCHCEECVVNLAAMMGMSPPALSHHLRQLRESGLIVSRRDGKEVYYKAAESEQAQLLHRMIERTVEIACPEEGEDVASAPHLPPPQRAPGRRPARRIAVAGPAHRRKARRARPTLPAANTF